MKNIKVPRLLAFSAAVYMAIRLLEAAGVFNGYVMHIVNQSLIYVILAVSLNLINGISGQFSLGHMGFAAVGAYMSGSLTTIIFKLTPDSPFGILLFVLAVLAGGLAAALIGVVIGFPSLRLKGDYLAIVTLGFGEIIKTVFNSIEYVGGPRGLSGIPKFSNFTVIFVATVITVIIIRNLIQSSHGRALLSIRENELAAELVGVNTTKYKVIAFATGAFFAGVAGALLGHLITIVHPSQYGFMGSVLVLIMVYAGGVGSLTGSVVAAFVLTFMSEGLRIVIDAAAEVTGWPIGGEWRMVIYSLLLIFIMLFRTEGLMGTKESSIMVIKERE